MLLHTNGFCPNQNRTIGLLKKVHNIDQERLGKTATIFNGHRFDNGWESFSFDSYY